MQVKLFHPTQRNTPLIGVRLAKAYRDWFELYFSYDTIIAFQEAGREVTVTHNIWSSTTGRHLNEIDGGEKKDRVDHNTFQKQLGEALERFFNA